VHDRALRGAEHWITERRTTWERRLDRLDALLAEDDDNAGRTSS